MDRKTTVVVTCVAVVLTLSTIDASSPSYIWNASDSVPTGLYRLKPAGHLKVTDLVAVRPPETLARFMASNGYLPIGVPMLKRVLGLAGQTVCRNGTSVEVDRIEMGEARELDGRGRRLPAWRGCLIIGTDEVFLMNWQSAQSLDGRYFGLLPMSAIIGRVVPVWTDE
jgi:conjugative transfer signal peptidase TraF